MTMPYDDAGTSGIQRFEVFTGAGRRRDWPVEVKVSIVAESFSGQETVCAVAPRRNLAQQCAGRAADAAQLLLLQPVAEPEPQQVG